MPDAFVRAAADPLRPARVFAPVFLVGALVFLVVAVVGLVTALGAEPRVLATGTGGRIVLPQAQAGQLTVYGAAVDGSRPTQDVRCDLQTGGAARAGFDLGSGTLEVDGRRLYLTGEVDGGWEPGDVLTCDGRGALAVTTGGGPGPRLGLALLGAFGAVLSAGLAAVGFGSRRRRRTDAGRLSGLDRHRPEGVHRAP